MDTRGLRDLFGHFATGVAVVTAADREGVRAGCTINSFTSISLAPELVMFSLMRTLLSLPVFRDATRYAVNFLAADQQSLSHRFAKRGEDKWTQTSFFEGGNGAPVLSGALAHIECELHQLVEAGDHFLFLCRVTAFATDADARDPLVFFKGRYRSLGPAMAETLA